MGLEKILVLILLFVGVVVGVVFISEGQRRIPTQSAKHVRGRRVFGGSRQYLPLRVNQAGVMPIIFASSLLLFPLVPLRLAGHPLSRRHPHQHREIPSTGAIPSPTTSSTSS